MPAKIFLSLACIAPAIGLASCGQSSNSPTTQTPNIATPPTVQYRETETQTGVNVSSAPESTLPIDVSTPSSILAGESITKQVSYNSPGGKDDIEFTIVTTDGIVSSVSVKEMASNPLSAKYQKEFSEKIGSEVIGKKKSDLNLDAVAGASLTTDAFNEFLSQK